MCDHEPYGDPSRGRGPLTPERKSAFLDVLGRTGSVVRAAAAATPWATGVQGGAQTFRDERLRDPEFSAAWDAALEAVLGAVEEEIVRRAMEVPRRPVWERGEVKGWVEDRNSADKLLMRLAAKLEPAWRERTSVDQSVTVQGVILSIAPMDVMLLPKADRQVFLGLLEKISAAKGEDDEVQRLPAGGKAKDSGG